MQVLSSSDYSNEDNSNENMAANNDSSNNSAGSSSEEERRLFTSTEEDELTNSNARCVAIYEKFKGNPPLHCTEPMTRTNEGLQCAHRKVFQSARYLH